MKKMIIAIVASLALGTLLGWSLGSGRGHEETEHAEHAGEEEHAEHAGKHADHGEGEVRHDEAHSDEHAEEGQAEEAGHDDHGGHEGEGRVEPGTIEDSMLSVAGIVLDTARAGILAEVLPLPGSVRYDPSRSSKVSARFAGVLRTWKVRPGDRVSQGELLATIESDATLEPYEVRAVRGGTVVHMDASVGQALAAGQVLAEVVDLGAVVLDLKAGARDLPRIRIGQGVTARVEGVEREARSKVAAILPGTDGATQTRTVRLVLANPRRDFSEGQFAQGIVEVGRIPAKVLVPRAGVQSSRGRDVVYVREGNRFEERVVVLGRKDARLVEVVSGLEAGETVAARGSFVVKADLGKSEAEHVH